MTPTVAEPPFVSVIVPVYNDAVRVRGCLDRLTNQDYPKGRYEVIVVDNGSTDETPQVLEAFRVTRLVETAARSSYVARNVGVRAAAGSVLAFTDSDCRPSRDWLTRGVDALAGADLAGGAVRFAFSARPSGAELFDSVSNMQVARNVAERGVAKTANLFVRAGVFEAVGGFPPVRSGGDVAWTRRATDSGFRLVYAPDAVVEHPARRLTELVRKQHRVGRGQPFLWASAGWSKLGVLRAMALAVVPDTTPWALLAQLRPGGAPVGRVMGLRVWSALWACRLATLTGNVRTLAHRVLPRRWRRRFVNFGVGEATGDGLPLTHRM